MAISKVEICGVDTSKLPKLTTAQMTELMRRVKQGDNGARDDFIKGNLRLVLSVIQRFTNRCDSPDDLFQVGCIGLMKSIDNFDTTLGVRFSTYAVPMIIGEIRRYLRDNNAIRVSRSLRDTAYKALQVRDALTRENQKEPTIEDLARAMDMPKEDVAFALDSIQDPVSLFEPIYHDSDDALFIMDQIKDDKDADDKWVNNLAIKEAMDRLGDRERKIVSMRFFQGRTQMEVAQEIGISQAQVSRLEKNALSSMRKHI